MRFRSDRGALRRAGFLRDVARLAIVGGALVGGAVGGTPAALASDVPMAAYVQKHADLIHADYVRAYEAGVALQYAVTAFLEAPSAKTLAAARVAWTEARKPYLETEAFRFYGGPIDFADPATGEEGPEGRMNAWPVNEAFMDYTKGRPEGGIVFRTELPMTLETVLENDQISDEADVTTGWHAIEFLLWGQDFSTDGPGDRSYTDYLPGEEINDRRRAYLSLVTAQLVEDLAWLRDQWVPGADTYRAEFVSQPQVSTGHVLTGLATLAAFEMASERIAVALQSGDQEDEQSCFSDTTHNDFIHDLKGIANVWQGGPAGGNAALKSLVAGVDAELAAEIDTALATTEARIADIPTPIDAVLASPEGSEGREKMRAAVAELEHLARLLLQAGDALGVQAEILAE